MEFPKVEVNQNLIDILVENPLLINFFKDFIEQKNIKCEQREANIKKFIKQNEELRASKDRNLREIFKLTHEIKSDASLCQPLSRRMQIELNIYRKSAQLEDEELEKYQIEYKDWREQSEEQMQKSSDDKLYELSQSELEVKIEAWKQEAENATKELKALEAGTQENNARLDAELQALQADLEAIIPLTTEMDETIDRLKDQLKEIAIKNQKEIDVIEQQIETLQKRKQQRY